MPCIWGVHNNSQIFLNLTILDASKTNLAANVPVGAPLGSSPPIFKALVDTGAQRTMISTNVVSTLNLISVGKLRSQGIGPNATAHNAYLFHVAFVFAQIPLGTVPVPGTTVQAMVFVNPNVIYGGEITSTGGAFDVLLGMDILSNGTLNVQGNGQFCFSI